MRGSVTKRCVEGVATCLVASLLVLSCSEAPEQPVELQREPFRVRSPSMELSELVHELAPFAGPDVAEPEIPDEMIIRMVDLSPRLTPRQRGQLLQSVLSLKVNVSGAVRAVSFAESDLRGARLAGRSLIERLENKSFSESYTDKDYLSGTHIFTADLSGVDLRRALLDGVDLHGANLSGARLVGASLKRSNLQGAILNRADLRSVDLRGADLRGAYLQGAKLDGVQISGAKLEGTRGLPEGLRK